MFNLFLFRFGVLAQLFRTRRALLCENLVLRQQLVVLKRRRPRPHPAASEAAALGIRPLLPGGPHASGTQEGNAGEPDSFPGHRPRRFFPAARRFASPLLPGCLAGSLSTSSNCILIYTCGAEPLAPIDTTTNNQEFRGRIVISIPPLGLKTRPMLARMKLWRGTASLMEPIGASSRKVVDAKSLKNMVGPCGLEPHTSTVSKNYRFTLAPETPARRFCRRGKSSHVHRVPKRLSVRAW